MAKTWECKHQTDTVWAFGQMGTLFHEARFHAFSGFPFFDFPHTITLAWAQ